MYIQRTIKKYIVWVGMSSFILPSNFAVKKWDTKAHSTLTITSRIHATTQVSNTVNCLQMNLELCTLEVGLRLYRRSPPS